MPKNYRRLVIPAALRRKVLKRDTYCCALCGMEGSSGTLNIDHIMPNNNALNNLVTLCFNCHAIEASKYFADLVIKHSDHYNDFATSISSTRSLLNIKANINQRMTLNKLLYANAIAAMETYLSDKFISSVMNDKDLLKRMIKNNPDYKKRQVPASEMFEYISCIKENVKEYLLSQIYHRLEKVKPMYESTFCIVFPEELDNIFTAIIIRHDIVHRNGRTKDGKTVDISEQDVVDILVRVENFIKELDKRINERSV
jgi:hypothetical protein